MKGWRIINRFEGPNVHMIYEVTITCIIYDNTGHPYQVEIPNSLYVPNGHERPIRPQYCAQNTKSADIDTTTLYGTRCDTHHNRATLVWGGSRFVCTVSVDKHNIFSLHNAPGHTVFNTYCTAIGYYPFLHHIQSDCFPANIYIFIHLFITHSMARSHLHTSLTP